MIIVEKPKWFEALAAHGVLLWRMYFDASSDAGHSYEVQFYDDAALHQFWSPALALLIPDVRQYARELLVEHAPKDWDSGYGSEGYVDGRLDTGDVTIYLSERVLVTEEIDPILLSVGPLETSDNQPDT